MRAIPGSPSHPEARGSRCVGMIDSLNKRLSSVVLLAGSGVADARMAQDCFDRGAHGAPWERSAKDRSRRARAVPPAGYTPREE